LSRLTHLLAVEKAAKANTVLTHEEVEAASAAAAAAADALSEASYMAPPHKFAVPPPAAVVHKTALQVKRERAEHDEAMKARIMMASRHSHEAPQGLAWLAPEHTAAATGRHISQVVPSAADADSTAPQLQDDQSSHVMAATAAKPIKTEESPHAAQEKHDNTLRRLG
jgi:hypothetical protein